MLVAYSTKAFDRGELVFTTATSIVVNWFSQQPPWVNGGQTPVVIMPLFLPLFLPSFFPFRDNHNDDADNDDEEEEDDDASLY